MKVLKSTTLFSAICLLYFACRDDKVIIADKLLVDKHSDDSSAKVILKTFGLIYPNDLKFDSNALLFYCSRTYDTSSLVYIQKENSVIQGVFYMMLPNYHRYITDYADKKSNLLFFEGYSFTVDSTIWQSLRKQADSIFQYKDNKNIKLKYTDGATYALYYNLQSRHGNSYDETVYEGFDKYLKEVLLNKFMQERKPIMYKVK
jgi:hypothetical protein